ncbi:MAG: hypothetical protein V4564_20035 [Pseudomonadota bacterium]
MRTALWLILPLTLVTIEARAQTATQQTEPADQICIDGPRWGATLDESRRIEAEPIPPSYRRLFESTAPCTRWALDKGSVVDWHLRFGSDRSITAALAYLEQDYTRAVPAPDAYPHLLDQAFRMAVPDLKRAAALKQPTGLTYSVSSRFIEGSKPIRRFQELVRARENYIFLARHYLRAAEAFGSATMLATADRYLGPAVAGAEVLTPLEQQPPVEGLLSFNLDPHQLDHLRARAAIVAAQLRLRPEDIDRARVILQSIERPIYHRLAETAFSGGDDFCDIAQGWNDAEPVAAACRADDDMQQKVVDYWIDRAALDLIVAPGGDRPDAAGSSLALATRLLTLEQQPDRSTRCCGRSATEDMLDLLLLSAGAYERRLRATTVNDANAAGENWWRALGALQQAERLARPYEAPARFTRIAGAWLKLWSMSATVFPEPKERLRYTGNPDMIRYAGYLATNMAGIAASARAEP